MSSHKSSKSTNNLRSFVRNEKPFLILVVVLGIFCYFIYPYPQIAMWVGFMLAGYSAVANDSIQTIGTFISSNSKRPWYYLWIFMGLIWTLTVTYSWMNYGGDVTHQRLTTKGFEQSPEVFTYGQIAAPLVLLILTRLRMPVSTSILLLSIFSTRASSVGSILGKSFFGYFLAFITAFVVWYVLSAYLMRIWKGKAKSYWVILQWITSGSLWSVWIMQDAANIAVYLPRQLSPGQFIFFTGYIFIGLGLLFYLKGDKIQGIINEKSNVVDVRYATMIDFVYSVLLFYLKFISTIPISTTWVFIGLLGGRELAYNLRVRQGIKKKNGIFYSFQLIKKDIIAAAIGLIVSLTLAILINKPMQEEFFNFFR